MKSNWINSKGGPFICGNLSPKLRWRGVHGSSIESDRSDYERACDVTDYIGVIPCGETRVLVLGDEPLQTSFLKLNGSLFILRWISFPQGESAFEIAENVLRKEKNKPIETLDYFLEDSKLSIFDAASDTDAHFESISTFLSPGWFSVTAEIYQEKGRYEFLIHRFIEHSSINNDAKKV